MVSYKEAINEVLKALLKEADYLQVPANNISRNRSINYKPPFIALLPYPSSSLDTESVLAKIKLSIIVSVKSEKTIDETQDNAMDLQARILSVMKSANIDFDWLGSNWYELNEKDVPLDNPLLEIETDIFYNPNKVSNE